MGCPTGTTLSNIGVLRVGIIQVEPVTAAVFADYRGSVLMGIADELEGRLRRFETGEEEGVGRDEYHITFVDREVQERHRRSISPHNRQSVCFPPS